MAVTVKLPAVPTVNVALLALVIAGAWLDEALTVKATVAACRQICRRRRCPRKTEPANPSRCNWIWACTPAR